MEPPPLWTCATCNVMIPRPQYAWHMRSDPHLLRFREQHPSAHYPPAAPAVPPDFVKPGIAPGRNSYARRSDGWYCEVCELDMHKASKVPHLNGRPHAVKMAKRGLPGKPVWTAGVGVVVRGATGDAREEGEVWGGEEAHVQEAVRGDVQVGEEYGVPEYTVEEYGEEVREGEEGYEEEEYEEEEGEEGEGEEEADEGEGEEAEDEGEEQEPYEEVVHDDASGDWPEIPNQNPSSMSWRCTVCDETMSVFFKDDHLSSKPHMKRFLGRFPSRPTTNTTSTTTTTSSNPLSMTWECTTCDETMNVFYKEEHLSGKRHLKSLRSHSSSRDSVASKEVPESVTSAYWTPEENFIEATAAETPAQPEWAWAAVMPSMMTLQTAPGGFRRPTVEDQAEFQPAAGTSPYPEASGEDGLELEYPAEEAPGWSVAPEHNPLWGDTTAQWTCTTCSITISIGERDTHLASVGHLERCNCSVCILNRPSASKKPLEPEHETGDDDEQAKVLPDEPAAAPAESPRSPVPGMFSCGICSADFPLEYKWMHLSRSWKCTVCARWLHVNWREIHLERHAKRAQLPEPVREEELFYCAVCDLDIKARHWELHQGDTWHCTVCELTLHHVAKAQHVAGESHVLKLEEQDRSFVSEEQDVGQGDLIDLLGDVSDDPIRGFPTMPLYSVESNGWGLDFGSGEPHLLDEALEPEPELQCRSGTASVLGEHPDHESTYGSQSTLNEIGDEDTTLVEHEPETFRCAVCGDREFPAEMKQYHLGQAWECKLCAKTIHQSSRDSHTAGASHQARERRAAAAAALAPDASETAKFHCVTCNRSVKTKQERIHRTRPWECTVCNLTMHIAWRHSHTAGRKHLKRLEEQVENPVEPEPEPEPVLEPEIVLQPQLVAQGLPAWAVRLRKLQRVQARHAAWVEEMKIAAPGIVEVYETALDAAAWTKRAWALYRRQIGLREHGG